MQRACNVADDVYTCPYIFRPLGGRCLGATLVAKEVQSGATPDFECQDKESP
jgi:hypothetical protein